jgi:4-alpha-glucanotransferase
VEDVRESGVLLHLTSLPGGRLGEAAFRFVDWLAEAGQSWWQVLPITPPDAHRSPYSSPSAFAAWSGLLADPDAPVRGAEVDRFRIAHADWAPGWERFAGSGVLADQIRFEREWRVLRHYAAARGVRMIGDLPIYVAPESADHAQHPELFRIGLVAGAPPDKLSADGQLWGNPVYDWAAMRREGYAWWIARMRRMCGLFDLVRIDHFRGFVSGWEIPERATSPRAGHWGRGPGHDLFDALRMALGPLPVIAEDLGRITPAVVRLRQELGFPGMVVLIWAFARGPANPYAPDNHPVNAVAYTGTHDTPTIAEWWAHVATDAERADADLQTSARGIDDPEPHWRMVRLALASRARMAILPMQDVLGLGAEARMNRPGTDSGNWGWRLTGEALDTALAARFAEATRNARRGRGVAAAMRR